jgi:hypothetical protein
VEKIRGMVGYTLHLDVRLSSHSFELLARTAGSSLRFDEDRTIPASIFSNFTELRVLELTAPSLKCARPAAYASHWIL